MSDLIAVGVLSIVATGCAVLAGVVWADHRNGYAAGWVVVGLAWQMCAIWTATGLA